MGEVAKVKAIGVAEIEGLDIASAFKDALSNALKSGLMKELQTILTPREREEFSSQIKTVVNNYSLYVIKYKILKMGPNLGEMEGSYGVEVEVYIDTVHLWETLSQILSEGE